MWPPNQQGVHCENLPMLKWCQAAQGDLVTTLALSGLASGLGTEPAQKPSGHDLASRCFSISPTNRKWRCPGLRFRLLWGTVLVPPRFDLVVWQGEGGLGFRAIAALKAKQEALQI